MRELSGDADLAHESFRANRGAEFLLQDLDRDFPLVLPLLGEVHRRHAAVSEQTLDVVAIAERGLQGVGRRGGLRGLDRRVAGRGGKREAGGRKRARHVYKLSRVPVPRIALCAAAPQPELSYRLKNWTARSCFLAAARLLNVPRLRRLPVFGFFLREYRRY